MEETNSSYGKPQETIAWFSEAISRLPADPPVALKTVGFNNYRTHKEHWLGWLDPISGTGTFARKDHPGRGPKYVYNHIMEPLMLMWIIRAAGISLPPSETLDRPNAATSMAGKCAAIRRRVPWEQLADALKAQRRLKL